jgi:hypothetical protein
MHKITSLVLVLAALVLMVGTAQAAPRPTPFSVGESLDPGTDGSPCGPTDANCFVSLNYISPVGTGAGQGGFMAFRELIANGLNAIGFKAPDSIGADVIWTLPGVDGAAGQFLSTDGSGNLSWGTASGGGATTTINSTTTSITSNATTTITSATTTINSTSTNITSSGTTTLTASTTIINSSSTVINSSSTTITGTTTLSELVIGNLTGFLTAVSGVVSATSSIDLLTDVLGVLGINFGGTGTSTAPTSGDLLVGNSGGTYDYISTSTLGNSLYASTSINAEVLGATQTGIFFADSVTGKLVQDTANFNYDNVTKKLTVTGGIDPLFVQVKDISGAGAAFFEAYDGNNAAVSVANTGRIRYSTSTQSFEMSMNGSPYQTIAIAGVSTSTFGNLVATSSFTSMGTSTLATTSVTSLLAVALEAGNATITNATATNLFATLANMLTAFIGTLTGNSATFADITATSSLTAATTTLGTTTVSELTGTNATITNATTTTFYTSIFRALTAFFTDLEWTNATGTNATTTGTLATNNLTATGTTALATTTISSLHLIGTTTAENGFDISDGCYAINSVCIGASVYGTSTATNGITFATATNVFTLGGTLNQATSIDFAGFTLNLNGVTHLTSLLASTTYASTSYAAMMAIGTTTAGPNTLVVDGAVTLNSSSTPNSANNAIYNDDGLLFWNGLQVLTSATSSASDFSLELDGATGYASRGVFDAPLNITGEMTIAAWVKVPDIGTINSGEHTIVSFGASGETAAANYSYMLKIRDEAASSDQAELYYFHEFGAGTNYEDDSVGFQTASDRWMHVAITRTAQGGDGALSYYINGTELETVSIGNQASGGTNGRFYIGSNLGTADFFEGNIDDVRIYDRNLTGAEIGAIYNSGQGQLTTVVSDGLQAWYAVRDNATPTVLADLSGNGFNMTIAGTASQVKESVVIDNGFGGLYVGTIKTGTEGQLTFYDADGAGVAGTNVLTLDDALSEITLTGSLVLASVTPATTTNALYQQNSTLYWNGLAVGSGGPFTASTTGGLPNDLTYLTATTSSLVIGAEATTTNSVFEVFASSSKIAFAVSNIGTGLAAQFNGAVAKLFGSTYATSSMYAHNVDFGNTSRVRVLATTTNFLGITGIEAGTDGQELTLVNASSTAAFSLYNASTTSVAANRILTGTGADISLAADASVQLVYDGASSRWRVVGGSGGSAGATSLVSTVSATSSLANWGETILVDASSNQVTITLPSAVGYNGSAIEIKRVDSSSNLVIVDGFTTQTIDGNSTINVYANGASTVLRSDGTNVRQVADYNNGVTASYADFQMNTDQTANRGVNDHIKWDTVNSVYGTDITVDTSSAYATATGTPSVGRITLKAGKTYRLRATASGVNSTVNAFSYQWYNFQTGTVIGQAGSSNGNANNNSIANTDATATFTPTSDTVVEVRVTSTIGGTIASFANFARTRGYIEVIAGNAPVTGQSVDFVQVGSATLNQPTTAGAAVVFPTILAGNIPYNTSNGQFTLTAGKTYRLEGSPTGGAVYWYNVTGAVNITEDNAGNAAGANANLVAVSYFTPSVDSIVELRAVSTGSQTSANGASTGSFTALVQQVGSSASTEFENNIYGDYPTGGTTTAYTTLSQYTNFIQIAQTTTGQTLTLPSPTNTSLSRLVYVDNTGTANFTMHGISVLAGETAAYKWNGTTWRPFGNNNLLAAEYGENTGITDGQAVTTTLADVAGSSFTLPTAGVWEVIARVTVGNGNGTVNTGFGFGIYDTSNVLISNTAANSIQGGGGGSETDVVTVQTFITTTGATTYKLRAAVNSGVSGFTIQNDNSVGASQAGSSQITWKKIGGFLPIVGQTVDYASIVGDTAQDTNSGTDAFTLTSTLSATLSTLPPTTARLPMQTSGGMTVTETSSGITVGANTLTATRQGTYKVSGAVTFDEAAIQNTAVQIVKNGTTILASFNNTSWGVSRNTIPLEWTGNLSASDTIDIRVRTGGSVTVSVHRFTLSLTQLGSTAVTGFSFSGMTNALMANTLDNFAYAQSWNWSSASTTNALTMTANALTSGTLLSLNSPNASSTALALAVNGATSFLFGTNFATSSPYAHNVDFGNTSRVRVLATSSVFQGITGIAGGTNGEQLTITNASSTAAFTLYDHTGTTTSLAANRIITGTGADLVVAADSSINLVYDTTASTTGRWRVVGGSGSGSGDFVLTTGAASTSTNSSVYRMGQVGIGTTSMLVAASSSALYVAGEVWNTLATNTLRMIGQVTNLPQSPYGVAIKGKNAYVTVSGASHQFAAVDISDPTKITNQTAYTFPSGAQPRGVTISGNYAYVLTFAHNSLNVFDISTPNTVYHISSTTLTGASPNDIVVNGNYAYIANRGSTFFTIVDITNPTAPIQVGTMSTGATQAKMFLSGRYLYITNFGANTYSVFDVRDPIRPVLVGGGTGNGLSSPWDISVQGQYVYVTNSGASTVSIFRAVTPATHLGVGTITVGAGPMGMVQEGKYLYVTNSGANSINVIDTSASSTAPTLIASTTIATTALTGTPVSIALQGRTAYVASNGATSFFLTALSLGGIDTNAIYAGIMQAGDVDVANNVTIGNALSARSFTAGMGGILSYGGISLLGQATSTGGTGTTTIGASLYIASSTPSTTTNTMYQQGGTLYWNGSPVGLSLYSANEFATSTPYAHNVDFGSSVTSVRVNATTSAFLGFTGFTGGTNGKILTITNASSTANFILYNASTTSTAANRILTGQGADIIIPADASVQLKYDSISSRWRVQGSWAPAGSATLVSSVTSTTTLSTWGRTVIVDASSGPFTITLPTPVGNSGGLIEFKRTDSTTNVVTVEGFASTTIDGSFNQALLNNGQAVSYRSDGTNVQQLGQNGAGVFAEYGEISSIVDGQTFTNTLKDIQGSTTTIPSAGTWEITYYIYGGNGIASAQNNIGLYENGTNTLVPNSTGVETNPSGAIVDSTLITNTVQVTTTGPAVYKLRGVTGGANTFTVRNNSNLGAGSNGDSKIIYKKIAGQAAVTGQSVDYINVTRTTAQTVADDAPILFTNTIAGNIPYNSGTGQFTLEAGKTYKLEAGIRQDNTVSSNWRWTTSAGAALSSVGGACVTKSADSGDSSGMQETCTIIYTPTANTNVRVQNVTGASRVVIADSIGATYAIITQLGSSATTEYENNIFGDYPTGGYVATGTLSQYTNFFQIDQTTAGQELLLPTPANTNLARLLYVDNTGTMSFDMHEAEVAAGESAFFKWNGTQWKSLTNATAVAAEYGTVTVPLGSYTTANVSTFTDITGASFTLPSAGAWRVTYTLPTAVNLDTAVVRLTDTSNVKIGEDVRYEGNSATAVRSPLTNEYIVTTTGATTYKLRVATNNQTVGIPSDEPGTIVYQKISGYTPVIGQTVDYVSVTRAGTGYTTTSGQAYLFDTVQAGTIPYNTGTGRFTLEAGKTYELSSAIEVDANTGLVSYFWYNVTNATNLSGNAVNNAANRTTFQSDQQTATAIFTPTVDTLVEVRTVGAVNTNASAHRSFATIKQLGSSAAFAGSFAALGGNSGLDVTIGTLSNNFFRIMASTTEYMRVLATGQGLIGTTTIHTAVGTSTLSIVGTTTNGTANIFSMFTPAGLPAFLVKNNGQILVGSSTDSSTSLLVVSSSTGNAVSEVVTSSTTANALVNVTSGSQSGSIGILGSSGLFRVRANSGTSGGMLLQTGTATPIMFSTNDTERMRIGSAGNLLIGTSTSLSADSATLMVQGIASSTLASFRVASSSGATQFIIGANGSIGMGVATPLRSLHVSSSSASLAPFYFVNTNTNANSDGLVIGLGNTGTLAATNNFISFNKSATDASVGTVIGGIEGNGAGGVVYNTTSDERLKTATGLQARGLQALMGLEVFNYNWNESGVNNDGFFAQQLHTIFPQAVSVGSDEVDENGDLVNPWKVDYGAITPLLAQAIKDLNSKVDSNATSTALGLASTSENTATLLSTISVDTLTLADATAALTSQVNLLTENVNALNASASSTEIEIVSIMSTIDTLTSRIDTLETGFASTTELLATTTANLEALITIGAATTSITTDEFGNEIEEDTYVGKFFMSLIAWFAEVSNGIGDFFAKKVNTEEICVKKSDGTSFCVDGDELENMMGGAPASVGGAGDTGEGVGDDTPEGDTGLDGSTGSESTGDEGAGDTGGDIGIDGSGAGDSTQNSENNGETGPSESQSDEETATDPVSEVEPEPAPAPEETPAP